METSETESGPLETSIEEVSPAKTLAAKTGRRNVVSVAQEGADFSMLKQVPMTVQVEIGRTMMTLGEVLDELEVGSSIRLDRHAGDPVEVYVNGALFARAEVVLVQDQIGARIIELIDPEKGARSAGMR